MKIWKRYVDEKHIFEVSVEQCLEKTEKYGYYKEDLEW